MLYPLIENSIEHGLDVIDGHGHIIIAARELDDMIEITVKDNGTGFDREIVESALEKDSSRYGIHSVQSRIKLRSDEGKHLSCPKYKTLMERRPGFYGEPGGKVLGRDRR